MSSRQIIIPAIIPKSCADLTTGFETVSPFAHEVQVDIVDGMLTPFTSWPYSDPDVNMSPSKLLQYTKNFSVEVDFMVFKPEFIVPLYLDLGIQKVVIHLESTEELLSIIMLKREYTFTLGLSILNDTPLEVLTKVIKDADYVQLMGIKEIGSQAQPFDTRVLERIRILKNMYPDLLISVDGSVNPETLPLLYEAGARRFVSGSAIFKSEDPRATFEAMNSYGV